MKWILGLLVPLVLLPSCKKRNSRAYLESDQVDTIVGLDSNRTRFEKLIFDLGGNLPLEFADLVAMFESSSSQTFEELVNSGEWSPTLLLIPFGRSPEAKNTNFASPRVLYSGPGFFIGYVKSLNRLEVISLKPNSASEPQFLLVQNFTKEGGEKVKIEKANSQECNVCHQGGYIFTHANWSEFREMAKGIDQVIPTHNIAEKNFYHGFDLAKFFNQESLTPDIRTFDDDIRFANQASGTRRKCRSVCGNDLICRKQLFMSALTSQKASLFNGDLVAEATFNSKFDPLNAANRSAVDLSKAPYLLDFQNRIVQNWPASNHGYVTSILPDVSRSSPQNVPSLVDPRTGKAQFGKGLGGNSLSRYHDQYPNVQIDWDSEEGGAEFERSFFLSGQEMRLNPSFKRNLINQVPKRIAALHLNEIAHQCFEMSYEDILFINKHTFNISDAYQRVLGDPEIDRLVSNEEEGVWQIPTSAQLIYFGYKSLGYSEKFFPKKIIEALKNQNDQSSQLIKPYLDIEMQPLNLFILACQGCHIDGRIGPVIEFNDIAKIRNYQGKNTIKDKLTDKTMPPNEDWLSDSIRKKMLKQLN